MVSRTSLRSEKDRLNIDIYRGFIERFGLFWDRREALMVSYISAEEFNKSGPHVKTNELMAQ